MKANLELYEIWDGWMGNASRLKDDGWLPTFESALEYVEGHRDWDLPEGWTEADVADALHTYWLQAQHPSPQAR